jgi:hypothetical protein
VDSHQKDQLFLYEVAALLVKKGADVEINRESSDPIRSLENFEQAIRRVKHLIVMFGQVTPAWLLGRIRKAAKIVAEQFEAGENPLEGVWVYRLPGCTVPRMPFQVQVLTIARTCRLNQRFSRRCCPVSPRSQRMTGQDQRQNPFVGLRPFESEDSSITLAAMPKPGLPTVPWQSFLAVVAALVAVNHRWFALA